MIVTLKTAAFVGGQLWPAGVHSNWPDDITPPKGATKHAEVPKPEEKPKKKEADTLRALQAEGPIV